MKRTGIFRCTLFTFFAVGALYLAGCSTTWTDEDEYSRESSAATAESVKVERSSARTESVPVSKRADEAPLTRALPPRDDDFAWSGRAFPTGDKRTSAVWLEKGVPYEVMVGETFEYQMRVTNISSNRLEDVSVTDSIPSQLKVSEAQPRWTTAADGIATWDLGGLESGQTRVIQIQGSTAGTTALRSCASVSFSSRVCSVIPVVKPELRLTKDIPTDALLCEPIVARYMVTNPGTGTAKDLRIVDQLPANLVTEDGSRVVRLQVPALESGKSRELEVKLRAQDKGIFKSKANAQGARGLTAESAETTTVVRSPELELAASGPKETFLGRAVTFDWTVTNKGDAAAGATTVEAMVPSGARYVESSRGGRLVGGNKVVWTVGELDPKSSRKISATFEGTRATTLESRATAKAECASTVMASVQTKLVGIPAVLLEVTDVEDPIAVGDTETYTIRVTNQGTAPGTNIRITCTLEKNVEYVSSTGATRAVVSGSSVTFESLPSLRPRGEATWKVKVKAAEQGDTRFRVSMTSDQMKRPVEETEATNIYQ